MYMGITRSHLSYLRDRTPCVFVLTVKGFQNIASPSMECARGLMCLPEGQGIITSSPRTGGRLFPSISGPKPSLHHLNITLSHLSLRTKRSYTLYLNVKGDISPGCSEILLPYWSVRNPQFPPDCQEVSHPLLESGLSSYLHVTSFYLLYLRTRRSPVICINEVLM